MPWRQNEFRSRQQVEMQFALEPQLRTLFSLRQKRTLMKSWFLVCDSHRMGLEMRDVPQPTPRAGEILVRVHAAALNRGEFLANLKPSGPVIDKPCGIECAGEVIAIGPGVDDVEPGDRVMGRAAMAFSEFAILRAGNAIKVPGRLRWEQAGAATIAYITAYDMLWPGGALQPDEWLLITGVSSGVGVAALQLGKMIGARVIGTSGTLSKLEKLEQLGLDFGLPFRNHGFAKQVMDITGGQGVDLVVNNVGGTVFAECIRVLAFQGRLATVGHVDGETRVELDLLEQHAKRLRLFGVSNKLRSAEEIAQSVHDFTRDVLPAIADGRITPLIDSVYPFEELPQALARMNSNAHIGKIVLRI